MLQIAGIGIVAVMLAVFLKQYGSSYSILVIMAGCMLIFYFGISQLEVIVDAIGTIERYVQINRIYISSLLKMIGIAYIADFSSAICKDAGHQSIAGQIEMFGKLSIMAVSIPILLALLETVEGVIVGG